MGEDSPLDTSGTGHYSVFVDHLLETISAYLSTPSAGYAFMLEGAWGSGKTYYWRNTIAPYIASLKPRKAKLTKAIYVSLYGLRTAEEIDREIAFAIHPLLDGKAAKVASAIGRAGLSYFGVDTNTSSVNIADWANFDDVVICFDDLERCSMPINEALGCINQYVEQRAIPTFILCNEGALSGDSKATYTIVKEKVVGQTVKFRLSHNAVLDSVLDAYKANGPFYQFLSASKSKISKLFIDSQLDNIRILKRAVANLQVVYEHLLKLDLNKAALLDRIVTTVMTVTFEHLSGRGSPDELQGVATNGMSYLAAAIFGSKDERDYRSQFVSRYTNAELPDIFPSVTIFDWITTGFFDREGFKNEIASAIAKKSELETAIESVIGNFHLQDDATFAKNWAVVSGALRNSGIVSMRQLFQLYNFALYWSEMLMLPEDTEDIKSLFKDSVINACSKGAIVYDDNLDSGLYNSEESTDGRLKKYKKLLVAENEKLRHKHDRDRVNKLLQGFREGPDQAAKEFANELLDVPVFAIINPEELSTIVAGMENQSRHIFILATIRRYQRSRALLGNMKEIAGLRKFKNELSKLNRKNKTMPRPLSASLLELLIKEIDKILSSSNQNGSPAKTVKK